MKTGQPRKLRRQEKSLAKGALRIEPLAMGMRTATTLAQMQKCIYPKEMQEDPLTILSILKSTDLSCGLFIGKELVGYALFQRTEEKRTIYLYDIAVLPRLQHKGLGTTLAKGVLTAAWHKRLKIRMHVRTTSYPLFINRETLRAAGYRLVSNRLRRDWYFKEFGIHEDAHELVMEPIVDKTSSSVQTR